MSRLTRSEVRCNGDYYITVNSAGFPICNWVQDGNWISLNFDSLSEAKKWLRAKLKLRRRETIPVYWEVACLEYCEALTHPKQYPDLEFPAEWEQPQRRIT